MHQQLQDEEHLHLLSQAVKSFSIAITKLASIEGIEEHLSTYITTPNLACQQQAEEAFNYPLDWQPTGNDHLDKIFRPMFISVNAVSLFCKVLSVTKLAGGLLFFLPLPYLVAVITLHYTTLHYFWTIFHYFFLLFSTFGRSFHFFSLLYITWDIILYSSLHVCALWWLGVI